MLLSIIIPEYCGGKYVDGLIKNISISSGLKNNDYEIIFVDDCSPDDSVYIVNKCIETYKDINIRCVTHKVNKRQGGGRNTGLRCANGEWIVYLDQDDSFIKDSFIKLKAILSIDKDIDIYAFGYMMNTDGIITEYRFKNSQVSMRGKNYLETQSIPWTPWCYIYRKSFLTKNNLLFCENVRFEDTDYVIKATLLAKRIQYLDILGFTK